MTEASTTMVNSADSRALRLRSSTRENHERLDQAIMAAAAFESVANYRNFIAMQHRFHRDIAALYDDPQLQALLPGLAQRRRLPLIAADLADLGKADDASPATAQPPTFGAGAIDVPTALGWLYVAEGSNMGAALLRKAVAKIGLSDDHGGRHLAPAAEGPAAQWRAFTAALDAAELTREEDARVIAGANAAFRRVQSYADAAFA